MLKLFLLTMKLFKREWRRAEWYVVFFALLLAVSAVTSLHFYSDRLFRAAIQQSATILGGDLVVQSSTPLPPKWSAEALRLHLRTAEVWVYPSMISANNQLQIANIQAVSHNYPLVGPSSSSLMPQTAWVESRLLQALSLPMNSLIKLGESNFRITRVLSSDFETLNLGWMIAPKVLIRLADVPATRTVIPGSRVEYRLLLTGDQKQLQLFHDWVLPQLNASQRLLSVNDQQTLLGDLLQRMNNYLQLVLLVVVLMSGVAIAMSVQQYMRRHYAYVALWRCLGATKNQIIVIFILQLLIVALSAGMIGIILGYFLQQLFVHLFATIFPFPLPLPSKSPIILGLLISISLLFLFAYPLISELPYTSPSFIWRKEIRTFSQSSMVYWFILLGAIVAFLYWFMNFSLLTLFFIDVVLLSIGFLYVLCALFLTLLRYLMRPTKGAIRRGLSQLVQYPDNTSLQIVGFTLVLMAIFLLKFIRTDLVANWQQTFPQQAPNYFAINIGPADLSRLRDFFSRNQVPIANLYPMVRGRLVALNGKPIMDSVPLASRGHNALHRELNLSWMWQFPADNKLVAGHPFAKDDYGKPLLSVEAELAKNLQLRIGDELSFHIGNEIVSGKIVNIRSVIWTSFHPNFFVIFVPGSIESFPTTYITSFYLPPAQASLLTQLAQQFPNVTVIDVAVVLKQISDLINKITLALQYVFLFSLGIALLIFIAGYQASKDERKETYSLLRTLGATRAYMTKSMMIEFVSLGIIILIFSISLAYGVAGLINHFIFG